MLITMFTDISHCSQNDIAAYAVWAKANKKTFRHSAMFKSAVTDVNEAESKAVINGVFVVIQAMNPAVESHIIAQTDSTWAISKLSDHKHPLARKINEILAARGMTIEYRHVKGHRGVATKRNAVNTWCDEECRRLLRNARQRLVEAIDRESKDGTWIDRV